MKKRFIVSYRWRQGSHEGTSSYTVHASTSQGALRQAQAAFQRDFHQSYQASDWKIEE